MKWILLQVLVVISVGILMGTTAKPVLWPEKGGSSGPPHPSFFFGHHAEGSEALRAEKLQAQ